jgi:hypothetical protein
LVSAKLSTPRGQRAIHSPHVRHSLWLMDSFRQTCSRTLIPIGQLKEQIPHCTQREGSETTCPFDKTICFFESFLNMFSNATASLRYLVGLFLKRLRLGMILILIGILVLRMILSLQSPNNKTGPLSQAALPFSQNSVLSDQSYESGTTLAACLPFGPSSTENSTFCSASSFL